MSLLEFTVKHYRFRNDDGSESTATWKGAIDTPVSVELAEFATALVRLRFVLDDSVVNYTGDLSINVSYNGGASYQVGATSAKVVAGVSANLVDAANTTEQLTLPPGDTYTVNPGVVNNTTGLTTTAVSFPSATVATEIEWCLNLVGPFNNGDTLDFTPLGFLSSGVCTQFPSNVRLTINVPVFSPLLGYFVAQGIQYTDVPGNWEQERSDYGVRQVSVPVISGERVVIVQQPLAIAGRAGVEKRLVHRKAWIGTWGANSWMPPSMYDHLQILYESGTPFWIQFDDEMMGWYDTCRCVDGVGSVWMTSRNPIVPWGQTPIQPGTHNGNLFVNTVQQTSGFTVDNEYGIITFATPISPTAVVQFAYTWRCYVQILTFELSPIEDELARTMYVGRITFIQLPPNYANDPWTITSAYTDGQEGVL